MAQTTQPTQSTAHSSPSNGTRLPAREWAIVPLMAAAVAAVIWLLADPLLGVDLQAGSATHPTQITFPAAVVVAALAALAGVALRWLLRGTSRPGRTWTIVAGVVLAVSLLGPLGGRTAAAVAALAALHLAVGATIITGVRRLSA